MASIPNQSEGCHRTKAIHFFKIIHSDSPSDGKMRIPTQFEKIHGEGLSETAYLKLPNGEQWKVNLEKQDGKIWFHKGWKEFVDYYSLSHGHLLVFKYEGTSYFEVLIFDTSTLEIDYPFKGKFPRKDKVFQAPETEILVACPPCRKRKGNSPPARHQPQKKIRTKQDALEGASVFRSVNPFFQVDMHQSYTLNRLNILSMFCEKYFDIDKKQGKVILQVLDGRVWEVRYIFRKLSRYNKFEFCDGFKEYVEGNNLKVGDVCIFELIRRTKLTFKVSIFRKTDSSNCSLSQEFAERTLETKSKGACSDREELALSQPPNQITNQEFHSPSSEPNTDRMSLRKRIIPQYDRRSSSLSRFGAINAVTKFNSEYPYFESCIGSSPRVLWVPMSFLKRYIKKDGKFANLLVGEKSWSIKLVQYPNKACLSAGWFSFARENGIKPGDVCLFELINSDDIVMKVSIAKHLSIVST